MLMGVRDADLATCDERRLVALPLAQIDSKVLRNVVNISIGPRNEPRRLFSIKFTRKEPCLSVRTHQMHAVHSNACNDRFV